MQKISHLFNTFFITTSLVFVGFFIFNHIPIFDYLRVVQEVYAQYGGDDSPSGVQEDVGDGGDINEADNSYGGNGDKDGRTSGTGGSANSDDDPSNDTIYVYVDDPVITPTNPTSTYEVFGRVYIDDIPPPNGDAFYQDTEVSLDNQSISLWARQASGGYTFYAQQTTVPQNPGEPPTYRFSNVPGGYYLVVHDDAATGFHRTTPQGVYFALDIDTRVRFGLNPNSSSTAFVAAPGCQPNTENGQITLAWDPVTGATEYELSRSDIASPIYTGPNLSMTQTTPSVVNTGGQSYTYSLRRRVSGVWSAPITRTVLTIECAAPSPFTLSGPVGSCSGTSPLMKTTLSNSANATRYVISRKRIGLDSAPVDINSNILPFAGGTYDYFDDTYNPSFPLDPLDLTHNIEYSVEAINDFSGASRMSNTATPTLIKDCNKPNVSLLVDGRDELSFLPDVDSGNKVNLTWNVSHADVCTGTSAITNNPTAPGPDPNWNNLSVNPSLTGSILSQQFVNPPANSALYTLTCTNNNIGDVISTIPGTPVDITTGLAGYWALDEANWTGTAPQVPDSTANNNHGTAQGGVTTISAGKFGRAGSFDGSNDIISLGTGPSLQVQNHTLSTWVYLTAHYNTGVRIIFARSSNISNAGYEWGILSSGTGSSDQKLAYAYNDGGVRGWYTDTTSLNLNQWYHLAGVWNRAAGTVSFYVDGNLSSVQNTGTANITHIPGDTAQIGKQFNNGFFRGRLDDVRIYNKLLTGSEINVLKTSTINTTPDPLMVHWSMNEGSWNGTAGEVKDSGPNANHGTAANGANTVTTGRFANAGNFDGANDYVSANISGTSLSNTTVSFWFNAPSESGTKGIFQWANSLTSGGPFILVQNANNSLRFYVDGNYRATTAFPLNTWNHVAVTLSNSSTWSFYLNGALVGTYTGGVAVQANAATVYLGNGFNGYFNGRIDEFRLYNKALSGAEVNQLLTNLTSVHPLKTQFTTRNFFIKLKKPFLKTTGGDVHTNEFINIP